MFWGLVVLVIEWILGRPGIPWGRRVAALVRCFVCASVICVGGEAWAEGDEANEAPPPEDSLELGESDQDKAQLDGEETSEEAVRWAAKVGCSPSYIEIAEGEEVAFLAESLGEEDALELADETPEEASKEDPLKDALSWSWDFDDGAQGEGAKVTHRFGEVDEYLVVVSGRDEAGILDQGFCKVSVCRPAKRVSLKSFRIPSSKTEILDEGAAELKYPCAKVVAEVNEKVKVKGKGCVCKASLELEVDGVSCGRAEAEVSRTKKVSLSASCDSSGGDVSWKLSRSGGEGCLCQWGKSKLSLSEQ